MAIPRACFLILDMFPLCPQTLRHFSNPPCASGNSLQKQNKGPGEGHLYKRRLACRCVASKKVSSSHFRSFFFSGLLLLRLCRSPPDICLGISETCHIRLLVLFSAPPHDPRALGLGFRPCLPVFPIYLQVFSFLTGIETVF